MKQDVTLRQMIYDLAKVHSVNRQRFLLKHKREAEISDQLKKHAEEIGEFIKALDGKNDESPLCELWDCVFSMVACGLNGDHSTTDILLAYDQVMEKIKLRIEAKE